VVCECLVGFGVYMCMCMVFDSGISKNGVLGYGMGRSLYVSKCAMDCDGWIWIITSGPKMKRQDGISIKGTACISGLNYFCLPLWVVHYYDTFSFVVDCRSTELSKGWEDREWYFIWFALFLQLL
jgi:hypothetical protein